MDCFLNVEFHGVISSCDSLDVKIDKLGLLKGLDVVKVDDSEKIDENSGARSDQAKYSSVVRMGVWEDARSLDVEEGVTTALC